MLRQGPALALLGLLAAQPAQARPLTVAVAANMMPAMEEIRELFRRHPGGELVLVSGSSGKFAAQILNGAPFDVFVSADLDNPRALEAAGLAAEPPAVYAHGRLVAWTRREDLDPRRWRELLDDPRVRKLAVPDPKTAPYGRAALEALRKAGAGPAALEKVVMGESVAQTNQFIESGAADLGFTAKSVVLDAKRKAPGRWADVDPSFHAPIVQALVVLRRGKTERPGLCRRLVRTMLGPEGRRVLERYGYALEPEAEAAPKR